MQRLTFTDADRGPDGRLLLQPRTLAELLPDAPESARATWRPGRAELAGIVGGLVLAVALIAAMNTFAPAPATGTRYGVPTAAPQPTTAPTIAPSPTVAGQSAYASPGGALLGTIPLTSTLRYRHSDWPGWAGVTHDGAIVWIETTHTIDGLIDLAPPPTARPVPTQPRPAVAPAPADAPCDPLTNPRYRSPLRVDPIGSVVGVSCVSQGEADENARKLAAELEAKEGR